MVVLVDRLPPAALLDKHGWSSLLRPGYYYSGSTTMTKTNNQSKPLF